MNIEHTVEVCRRIQSRAYCADIEIVDSDVFLFALVIHGSRCRDRALDSCNLRGGECCAVLGGNGLRRAIDRHDDSGFVVKAAGCDGSGVWLRGDGWFDQQN